ncbi:MAG: ATP-binding protein [Alphaproteobacteria bacterium]
MKKDLKEILIAIAFSLISLLTTLKLVAFFPSFKAPVNIVMIFLTAVLFCAVWRGLTASLITAILTFFFYNFFFTEPYHTLMVKHWYDTTTLLVFLVVAITTGSLAGRVKDQALKAKARVKALQSLYDLARSLSSAKTSDEILEALALEINHFTECPVLIFSPQDKDPKIIFSQHTSVNLEKEEQEAAKWSLDNRESSGAFTNKFNHLKWHFRIINDVNNQIAGVLGIKQSKNNFLPESFLIVDTMLDQTTAALERITFAKTASHAEALAESERFRNALLSSISHDLKTPLTSILGSATTLNTDLENYSLAAQKELIATIREEAERLDRFVNNLLDITKLESGSVKINKDWIVVSEVIDAAVRRVKRYAPDKKIIRKNNAELPLLKADFVMLDTVLFNLLDNSVKYSGKDSTITINSSFYDNKIIINVIDDGAGISQEHLPFLFDKFYRVKKTDYTIAGTGLGLSICKGLIEAMGGSIEVISPFTDNKGVCFKLSFIEEKAPDMNLLNEE